MITFDLHRGTVPLLISCPHDGIEIPNDLRERMTPDANKVPDTDWHIAKLYDFARTLGASILRPKFSRYVIDLNRPSDGAFLYPGKRETGLVPIISFADEPIYLLGKDPTEEEKQARVARYWRPYHSSLADEISRIKHTHGRCVLWEAHSIRSEVPMLFEGRLPDFNFGTADGASCLPEIENRLRAVMQSQERYSFVFNGRFKGGYITRHYGDPKHQIHAIQLELTQNNYMDEDSFEYREGLATPTQRLIEELLKVLL